MREIPLTRGYVALVDDEDYERVAAKKWGVTVKPQDTTPYAQNGVRVAGRMTSVAMHRFILDAPIELVVDHINGNGLDNRRANLRLCSRSENQWNRRKSSQNTSGFKGVFHRGGTRWIARITAHGKTVHLGRFRDPTIAARAYDAAALRLHGEFARLNFPTLGQRAA